MNRLFLLVSCMLLMGVTHGQVKTTNDRIKSYQSSLDSLDVKDYGNTLFFIAKEYLERTPNVDSFQLYMDKVKTHARRYNDSDLLFRYHYYMGVREYRSSEYERAIDHMDKAEELSVFSNDSVKVARMFYVNGVIQKQLGNDDGFQENMLKGLEYAESIPNRSVQLAILVALSIESGRKGLFDQQKMQLDTAIKYMDKVGLRTQLSVYTEMVQVNLKLFERDKLQSNFDEASSYLKKGIALADSVGNKMSIANLRIKELYIRDVSNDTPQNYFSLGDTIADLGAELEDPFFIFTGTLAKAEALLKMNMPEKALALKTELLKNADLLKVPSNYRDLYKTLYQASYDSGRYKSALDYNNKYLIYHDSILSLEKSIAYSDVLEKYESEKKAKEILELTQEKKNLQMETVLKDTHLRQQYLFFGLVLLLLCFLGWIVYDMQQKRIAKVKMTNAINEQRLLRSQMNPHFLFNSLNSIKRFYVDGREDEADDFLSDFSTLLRKILDQSSKLSVPIEEELEFLRLYLELEKRRLNKKLEFQIDFNPDEFDYDDNIPSLILQPLVENSIWHGILKSDRDGKIRIAVTKENGTISCIVQDNGIGYHAVSSSKNQKYVSRGLNLVRDRIKDRGHLKIEHLYDNNGLSVGTKAELIIT